MHVQWAKGVGWMKIDEKDQRTVRVQFWTSYYNSISLLSMLDKAYFNLNCNAQEK
jgi:hypothetical protein